MHHSQAPNEPAAHHRAAVVRPGAPTWLRAVADLGARLDAARWAPRQLDARLRSRLYNRRKAAAAHDPTWAEIESRRDTGRDGSKTLLSDDLNWGHLETQWDIERRLVPDPWWLAATRALGNVSLARPATAVVAAVDRLRRGWDTFDAANLCSSLPRQTGEQLQWLADHVHGWPGEESGYPTPEDWVAELRHHAVVLTTHGYGRPGVDEELLNSWSRARKAADSSSDPDDEERATTRWQALHSSEADAADAVVESMRWVAEHIHSLWD